MNPECLFTERDLQILQRARETYGPHKQIGVAAEECTELAKELIKAFRYDSFDDVVKNTKENVVDEVADVLIVLDHVIKLFNVTPQDLQPHVAKKLQRLEYWLDNSDSIEFTTKCREVIEEDEEEIQFEDLEEFNVDHLVHTKKGVYENEFLKLFDINDEEYRKANE